MKVVGFLFVTVCAAFFFAAAPAAQSYFGRAAALVPIAAKLKATATVYTDGVLVEWQTESEIDNLGFNLYRERDGARTRVNPTLIDGSAVMSRASLPIARSYSLFDAEGDADTLYYIEAVNLSGARDLSPPIAPIVAAPEDAAGDKLRRKRLAVARSRATLAVESSQARAMQRGQPASWNDLSANTTGLGRPEPLSAGNLSPLIPSPQLFMQRALAAQRAVKIGINHNGWYRIRSVDLFAAGLDTEVYAPFLQLYADGREVPIIVRNENTGVFGSNDYIEFYGLGLNTPSADTRVYYLIAGNRQGARIVAPNTVTRKRPIHIVSASRAFDSQPQTNEEGGTSPLLERRENLIGDGARKSVSKTQRVIVSDAAQSFPYTIERRDRAVFLTGLLTDGDTFFGPPIYSAPLTQTLTVTNLDPSAPTTLQIAAQGYTTIPHKIKVTLNNAEIGTISFNNVTYYAQTLNLPSGALHEGANSITLQAIGDSLNNTTDVSFLDYIRINYAHFYRADNNALAFSLASGATARVDGFASPAVRVIDITDPTAPTVLAPRIDGQSGNYAANIDTPIGGARTLYAFLDGASETPAFISPNQPSTFSRPENAADYVIITHGSLRSAVEPLRALRASQGLKVMVADVEDIYDEFSYGAHDPQAITEFFRYALTNWQTKPRFALLVGDASFDPRNYLGFGSYDLVPTKLVVTIYSKTSSDDALADFTNDGLAALAIGRLPARTLDEARTMIGKIVNYSPQTPVPNILFIADRTQADYSFVSENRALLPFIPSNFTPQFINRDEMSDDLMRARIVDGLSTGPLIANFAGHGTIDGWMGGRIFSTQQSPTLTNNPRLVFFSMMTCLNGYFHDANPSNESLAESLMKNPSGGAIAVWASSGLTVPTSQSVMNQELYRQMFGSNSQTLGEMIRQAKTTTDDLDVRRTWIYFGDPAMRIK
jgi:hypothetical protein